MKIEPCIKEILSDVVQWPVMIASFVGLCLLFNCNIFVVMLFFFIFCILFFFAGRRYIYLGRTIILTPEGCTFSILKYNRTYEWTELEVQFCENKPKTSLTLDIAGPGIMICNKKIEIPEEKAGPSFCRTQHPFESVFIRFKSKKDDYLNTWNGSRAFTYGYAIEKDVIIGYLKSIGVY